DHSLEVVAFPRSGPGRYQARIEALRPAADRDRLAGRTYGRFLAASNLPREERLAAWNEVLATWRRLREPILEGETLFMIGRDHHLHAENRLAVPVQRDAAASLARGGDRRWAALASSGLGATLLAIGEVEEALEVYRGALEVAREAEDRRMEAAILNGLALAHLRRGEIQEGLSQYQALVEILPEDDRATRPHALHNLGVFSSVLFHDHERGRELLTEALELWPDTPGHRRWKARTLSQLARIAEVEGELVEARTYIEEALALREGLDPCGRATQLARLGLLDEAKGEREAADDRLAEADGILGETSGPRNMVTVQLTAGLVAEGRGENAVALARYQRVRELAGAQGDRTRLADSLWGIAKAERALGRGRAGLEASRAGLSILEGVRPTLFREDLRTAFFATAQDRFDFQIDLLSELGAVEEAWATAERARAQALRDLLLEAGAGLRQGSHPDLAARERALQGRLDLAENALVDSVSEPSPESLQKRRQEMASLVEELEAVRGEIRRRSPSYAAVSRPEAISLAEVQEELLEEGTVLLEYRLGAEESWLWAITRHSFDAFTLPPRSEIEVIAREAVRWTRALRWPDRTPPPLCELSRVVLGPLADMLGGQRLVIVPDGALEELSFAALPLPVPGGDGEGCPRGRLLVDRHEVVYLPSVGTLAAQRHLRAGREPAPGWMAMVADPVYSPDDERLRPGFGAGPRPASLGTPRLGRFERLRYAGEEAEAILSRMPRSKTLAAIGLDASERTVSRGALAGHRIVHFATHGVLDPEEPLLSYLALSQVSPDGRPVDGALYAHAIYDLDLPAELVVLSACDTARGRQIRGEGLVSGLPRAFLYAGAARVLVSLWPVPDRSTRDLMDLFYRGLVEEGLPPGRALQQAQRALRQEGSPPYQWAGFVLQGDWRPLPAF
ncbi:MAG TPA: CHAT domain-containing tetratricopeptide repeat protein, partial [Thermoanaerobaculia bacterium]|nr:CHAT domain-containing tetratricopeptide repeat protein [Thermoanaerobaculia bacterium]